MRGSLAVELKRDSALETMPGAITPPRKSPLSETTSKVVAVPISMTISGPPYCSNAPTTFTILSAPIARGFS